MKFGVRVIKQSGLYIKRNYVILLSFFLPALILEIAYMCSGIFPFGKRDLLIIDLYHQYAPFISGLQDKFRSFSSLLYSWSGGLGISFLPLYAYYLASPLNILTVFFPKEYLTEAILVLTLLKVGLAGACFAFYLKGVHREQSLVTVAFSLLYALSSYVLVFSWNIMWMDTIYLFPLIMLGLVRMVRDNKGLFFCITLAIALLSNFYMAFFICMFTLLYYPVCLFQYHSLRKPAFLIKKTAIFAGWSLLSAGLSSVLLLPTFFALKLTSAAEDAFPKTLVNYFDIYDYITRHFTVASPSIREGMPNLYSGIVVLILLPIYFLCKSIKLKEKLCNVTLLLILIASFNINFLNFVWHGLHFPNQIPYRFSFVYIFLVLTMSYSAFSGLHEFSGKQIGKISLAVLAMVVISQKFNNLSIEHITVYLSIVFVIFYAAALTVDRAYGISHSYKALFLILVVAIEVLTNTLLIVDKIDLAEGFSRRDGYSSGKEVSQIREKISNIAKEDNGFYRMEILPPETTNDPFLYNYRGLSIFSSTAPVKPVKMLRNLGYHSNDINSYEYEDSTPVLDAILGIKYLIYRSINIEEKLYKQTSSTDELTVFTNPYALSLGFQAPKEFEKFSGGMGSNPFEVQNRLVEGICGVKGIFTPLEQKQSFNDNLTFSSSGTSYYSYKRTNKDMGSTARIQFEFNMSQEVYLYYKAPYEMKGSGFVLVNDKKVEFNPKHSTIINLGYCNSGTTADMEITFEKASSDSGSFEIYSCGLNQSAFENAIALIREKSMTVEKFTDTSVIGRVESENSGLMVMSIPYDKDWHIKVDGKEVKAQAIDECLLSFELPKGSHKVELRYYPEKFKIGLMITLASILVLILILFIKSGLRIRIFTRKQINQAA